MMAFPKVTVICLCYNQGRFVQEAIQSVMDQTYPEIELLVVDDASTDNSVQVIKECMLRFPKIEFIQLPRNSGNCKAFNQALRRAKGDFIIDLAADDILLEDRIAEGVKALEQAGQGYGVNFTDAYWIAEDGRVLARHSDRFPHDTIAQGDIYLELIGKFFICSPTMMYRREVIDMMGGYDESLAYEDFDFWMRSSRTWWYCYTASPLVKKRIVKNSMSQRQFTLRSPQLRSTFRVCEKVLMLNRTAEEGSALTKRILYEMRVCLRLLHFPLLWHYSRLLLRNSAIRYP